MMYRIIYQTCPCKCCMCTIFHISAAESCPRLTKFHTQSRAHSLFSLSPLPLYFLFSPDDEGDSLDSMLPSLRQRRASLAYPDRKGGGGAVASVWPPKWAISTRKRDCGRGQLGKESMEERTTKCCREFPAGKGTKWTGIFRW